MDQKITIKIGERDYVLKASSPESEEYIRLAAEAINKKLDSFRESFPGKNTLDLLSFVALNECVSRISLQRKMDRIGQEAEKLANDTGSYLKNIDRK